MIAKLASACAMALCLTVTAAAAETKLLFSTFFPQAHPLYADVFVPWAEAVKQETNGEVFIEFSASSLAPPAEQLSMVSQGIADLTVQFSGVLPNQLAPLMLPEVPGPVSTAENMSVALWKTTEKYFSGLDAFRRARLLSVFTVAPQRLFMVRDYTYNDISEMQAAKILTTPGIAAKAFGAITSGIIVSPAIRYFEFVSKGMVDAYAVATPADVISFNLAQYTRHIVGMRDISTSGSFALVVNQRKWQALSAEHQDAITRLSGEAFARRTRALDEANDAAIEKLKGDGVKFTDLPDTLYGQLKETVSFVEEEWINETKKLGINGREAMDFYRQTLSELHGQQR